MTINKTLPCSLFMLVSAVAFAADNTDAVMMDASPCLDIVSPIERLACFEEQANAAQGRGSASQQQNLPVVSIPRNARQQPAQSPSQAQPQPAAEPPQNAVPEVAQEVESPRESPRTPTPESVENNFGLPEEKINDRDKKANELIATVAELKELNRNRFIITLENGQVWEQMDTKRFILSEGDEVRIYATRWGNSFRLASLSHNGFIQVKRLR